MKTHLDYITEISFISENSERVKEYYVKKNYPNLYNDILEHISFYNIELNKELFTNKLWYFVNDIKQTIMCAYCNEKTPSFYKNWKQGIRKFCSSACTGKSSETHQKMEKTCLEKYGVKNANSSEIVKLKIQKTNLERYGYKSSFQSEKVRKKWRENLIEKYNVDHISKIKEVTEKTKQTHIQRYGGWFNSTDEYKILKNDWLKREYPNLNTYQESEDYKQKTINTNQKKYGADFYFQSETHKKLRKTEEFINKNKIIKFTKRKERIEARFENIELLKAEDSILTVRNTKCNHIYEIHYDNLVLRTERKIDTCLICLPHSEISTRSMIEDNMYSYLKEIYIGEVLKSYKIAGRKEVDVYIPELKLAIEFNGLYWHGENKKSKNYHIDKTKLCESLGIDLIHIWEDDWIYKEEIVKSLLKNRLKQISNKIYARECEVKVINDTNLVNGFLDKNHIQGKCNSKIRIGLYHNNILVSLMTFGNNRFSKEVGSCELLRFCSLLNTNIIGGASKLFKYFLKNYNYNTIISYADVASFKGQLYETLGFKYVHLSKPNYYWVINGVRRHRYSFRKSILVKKGYDSSKTGDDIMFSRGYYKIWGCGQVKYIFNNQH